MKKGFLLALFFACTIAVSNAQILKKTYYDLFSTKIREVYYVTAKGEKNGSYKSYWEDGLLSVEANYKNGALDGTYKEYQQFQGTGKLWVKKSETYANDELNGPAVYYGGKKDFSIPVRQGSYQNGKKVGTWVFIEEIVSYDNIPEGFQYYKVTQVFKADTVFSQNPTTYYYPSGKLYSEETKTEVKIYFPNGKIARQTLFDETGTKIHEKTYDDSGKLTSDNSFLSSKEQAEKQAEYEKQQQAEYAQRLAEEKRKQDEYNKKEQERKLAEKRKAELEKQQQDVYSKHKMFVGMYASKEEADQASPSGIHSQDYPKGKVLYEKSNELYQEYAKAYESEQDLSKKLEAGNNLMKLLDKMLSLASTDTKEINKQLKKAAAQDEVKQILGL